MVPSSGGTCENLWSLHRVIFPWWLKAVIPVWLYVGVLWGSGCFRDLHDGERDIMGFILRGHGF